MKLTTEEEKVQFILSVYFRTQAAIEKYMGVDGLPAWTAHVAEMNAESARNRYPERPDQARALLDGLSAMLEVYGSDYVDDEKDGLKTLNVTRCGIYAYRERARDQGVQLTLETPCEFCVDLRYRTAEHLGLEVSHELGVRSCSWATRTS